MEKKELDLENKYFDKLKAITKDIIAENQVKIELLDQDNQDLRQYMLDNVELDMESGDIDITAIQNGLVMERNVMVQTDLRKKNLALDKVKDSPFFGKIIICDEIGDETFYIGLQNIQREQTVFVVDWRAPICSLYYHSNLGDAYYNVSGNLLHVNLKQKRQFEVENGKIVSYYDTDDKVNDSLLLGILTKPTSSYMKNIVKSIQQEQDQVIRKNLAANVLVQGVAGSGKTSIAMHRIAYLLYDNKNLTYDKILFVSPNKLFSEYVSKLLPELGEENVNTYTLNDIFLSTNLINYTIEDRTAFAGKVFNGDLVRQENFEKKFGYDYLCKLKTFLAGLLTKQTLYEIIGQVVDLRPAVINKIYYEGPRPYMLKERMEIILQRLCSYFGLKKTKSEVITSKVMVRFKRFFDEDELYVRFMQSLSLDDNKKLVDNVATYLLFQMSFKGFVDDGDILHIVVDEMQDYDLVSYQILRLLYPKATFSVLGDINQNLLTSKSNLLDIPKVFEDIETINLKISYRSTKNIIHFANRVLGVNVSDGQSLRNGLEVRLKAYQPKKDLKFLLIDEITSAKLAGQKLAIITQTQAVANMISKSLEILQDVNLDNTVIIATTYMCKGLEFDKVVVVLSNQEKLNTQFEKQNLYVAITRALHEVVVLCANNDQYDLLNHNK